MHRGEPGASFWLPFRGLGPPFGSRLRKKSTLGRSRAHLGAKVTARCGFHKKTDANGCPGEGPKCVGRRGRSISGTVVITTFASKTVFPCGFRHIRHLYMFCRLCKATGLRPVKLCLFLSTATCSRGAEKKQTLYMYSGCTETVHVQWM